MQNLHSKAIPLHDIKPLLEIHEYSLYYFIGVSTIVAIIALGGLFLLYKHFHNKKKFNIRREDLKKLNEIDLNDTKTAAYALSEYGATFKDDSERNHKTYHDLFDALEKYKYKKSVDEFDDDTLRIIELYRGMLDV